MVVENFCKNLLGLIYMVQRERLLVICISDMVYPNTHKIELGCKDQDLYGIHNKICDFFDVQNKMIFHPGGFHIEITVKDVMECVGGDTGRVDDEDLGGCYHTQ